MTTIFEELGVRPVINAQGNRTLLGGGTPAPEIRALMDAAEDYYVNMSELMDAVGERIADMLDVDAALVTSGCSAALAYAAAACMTGDDVDRIERIPDTSDMPNEILIQRQLRVKYDRCMTIPGGRLVEIGSEEQTTVDDLESSIGSQTAAIHYLAPGDRNPGALPLETVIDVGHANGIPIIVDAAGQVYPTDLLSRYVKMGADLVAYGAKYFGSVNSSGLLTGSEELVGIARSHSFVGFEASPIRSFRTADEGGPSGSCGRIWCAASMADHEPRRQVRSVRGQGHHTSVGTFRNRWCLAGRPGRRWSCRGTDGHRRS